MILGLCKIFIMRRWIIKVIKLKMQMWNVFLLNLNVFEHSFCQKTVSTEVLQSLNIRILIWLYKLEEQSSSVKKYFNCNRGRRLVREMKGQGFGLPFVFFPFAQKMILIVYVYYYGYCYLQLYSQSYTQAFVLRICSYMHRN